MLLKKRLLISLSISLPILIVLFAISCSSYTYQPTKWDLSAIYNPLRSNLHPVYKVYHNNSKTSVLFLKVRTSEFFFREYATGNEEGCSFTVKYLLQEVNEENNFIVDSNTYVYEFRKSDINKYYITQIPIKTNQGKSYRLKVTISDNYRNSLNTSYLNIEKNMNLAEQYFNITTLNGTPIFKNVLVNEGAFRIHHASPLSDTLYISYYKENSIIPQPLLQSSTDKYKFRKHDSLFKVKFTPQTALSLEYDGVYHVQFDTSSSHGLSILKVNSDFPKIEEPVGLIPPLSYITTDAEFNILSNSIKPKKTADEYWLKVGGSISKGRELIRLYYNRVYFTNYYFTNTQPGWKTDRGMVYIVYGPPHKMKKTANSETWIYERKGDSEPITFTFNYSPTKYSLNKYILDRSNSHTWHWAEAVYAWTSGDIFLFD